MVLLAVDDEVVEFSALDVLHHEVDLAAVLEYLQQLHDVGVPQLLQDAQLAGEVDLVLRVHDQSLPQDLRCHSLTRLQVHRLLHSREGAGPHPPAHLVAAHCLAPRRLLILLSLHLL